MRRGRWWRLCGKETSFTRHEYSESPHHADRTVPVHTFRPRVNRERLYIKAYFLDRTAGTATFISVHRGEQEP